MQGTNIISVQWNELRGGDARLSSACNVRARHRGLDCLTSMIGLGKESVVADASAQYWLRDIAPGAYLIRVVIPERREVTGRVMILERQSINIVNLEIL